MHYLGIDLGGTNIVAGVVDNEGKILAKASCKTRVPRPMEAICDDMAACAREAAQKAGKPLEEFPWVGLGAPGACDSTTGVIDFSTNLFFENWPVVQMMEQRLKKRVFLTNDANAAAYGEYLAGAAKGTRNSVTVTLGTGVGGGIIIDGKIYSGSNDAGAEIGHMVIEVNGRPCTCGRRGCWEAYASATGLIQLTKEAIQQNRSNPECALIRLTGGNPKKVNGLTAFEAMRQGDPAGTAVVEQYLCYLGCGLVNIVNIFQPDLICLGGGISHEGETLLAPLRAHIERERYSRHTAKQTALCQAKLGNDAGIIGAAFLGKSFGY